MYDGRQIGNFILDFCDTKHRAITNLSLQKILYFSHVWTIVKTDKPLIRHDFEAWQFGPVLPYVYHDLKDYDRQPITTRMKSIAVASGNREVASYNFDKSTEDLLTEVVDFYSQLSPSHLVDLSHASDGPWANVWYHLESVKPGMKISNDDIKRYYSASNKDYQKFSS